jgi:hypothetical protein
MNEMGRQRFSYQRYHTHRTLRSRQLRIRVGVTGRMRFMHLPTAICAVRDVTWWDNVFLLAPWKFARWNLFPDFETVLGRWQRCEVFYLTERAACYHGL